MRQISVMLLIALLLFPKTSLALGSLAGNTIANTASLDYSLPAHPIMTLVSNPMDFDVQQVTDVALTVTNSPLNVTAGTVNSTMVFTVANTGNGPDIFDLVATSTLAGDQFDPALIGIYADSNDNGVYDAGIDMPIISITLAADAQATVFVVNNIPVALNPADDGLTQLNVTSTTASGTPGTRIAGGGVGGVDALAGNSGGAAAVQGSYVVVPVAAVTVNVIKTIVSVLNPSGSDVPVTGASVTYQLVVSVTGTGTATNVVITDLIPAYTIHNPDSLLLDGVILSEEADADAGDVGETTPNTVTVNLGDMVAGSADRVIQFQVTIN